MYNERQVMFNKLGCVCHDVLRAVFAEGIRLNFSSLIIACIVYRASPTN